MGTVGRRRSFKYCRLAKVLRAMMMTMMTAIVLMARTELEQMFSFFDLRKFECHLTYFEFDRVMKVN